MSKQRERRPSRSRSRDRFDKPRRETRENPRRRSKSNDRTFARPQPKYDRNRDSHSRHPRNDNPRPRHTGNRNRPENQRHEWGRPQVKTEPTSPQPEVKKEGPNFKLSGKLAEDTNIYNGVVVKYNEPAEARKPKRRWRLYAFKGDNELPMLPIHRQSAYLLGRERKVADIPIDHPSCSKQHAVLQYRVVKYKREDETYGKRVRPYIIDLESANGTFVNNQKIEARRFVELFEKDVIKFGFSTREYVVLHEESKDDELEDDDVPDDEPENPPETETQTENPTEPPTVTESETAPL
uniref:FHA domain-containing protein n=1 Tax=Strigamia maritima TaxID=126957 RepID=T1JKM7_STRMM